MNESPTLQFMNLDYFSIEQGVQKEDLMSDQHKYLETNK